jgi:CubicO group peptidase (beta-lactamase class C family)
MKRIVCALAGVALPAFLSTRTPRFAIGSIAKQFTAVQILALRERGRLSLDDAAARGRAVYRGKQAI